MVMIEDKQRLLLLRDTGGASPPAGGLGVLAADADTPVVTETAVSSDLLRALEILTELVVQKVREDLGGLAVLDVLLSVEEVVWDLVLPGVGDDGDNSLDLLLAQLTGALAHVYVGLLKSNVGEPAADTLDGGNGEHGVPLTLQVRVHHTKDVLEVVW